MSRPLLHVYHNIRRFKGPRFLFPLKKAVAPYYSKAAFWVSFWFRTFFAFLHAACFLCLPYILLYSLLPNTFNYKCNSIE